MDTKKTVKERGVGGRPVGYMLSGDVVVGTNRRLAEVIHIVGSEAEGAAGAAGIAEFGHCANTRWEMPRHRLEVVDGDAVLGVTVPMSVMALIVA